MKCNRKKILLILPLSTTKWGTENAGGVDSVAQLLIQGLVENNSSAYEYKILAFDPYSRKALLNKQVRLSEGVEVIFIPTQKFFYNKIKIPGLVWQVFRVLCEVRRFKPDLVHAHSPKWLLFISKKYRRLATLHGYKKIGRKKISVFNDLIFEKLIPLINDGFVDSYTCVGEVIYSSLARDTKKQIDIIGNPVSESYFNVVPCRSGNVLTMVTCAILTPKKRIERSILLTSKLKESGVDVSLKIIGPANDKKYFKYLDALVLDLGLTGIVSFLGHLTQDEIMLVYSQADMGIYLSEEETFGLAPLEMLAAGLPLFTTTVGVLGERKKEMLDVGVVYSNSSVDDVEAIRNLMLIDTSRSKNFVVQNFSTFNVNKSYELKYRELLGDD